MSTLLRVSLYLSLFFPFLVNAEGSKQLTPNTSGTTADLTNTNNTRSGFLAHDANFPSQTGVAATSLSFLKPAGYNYNGATYSEDHRLYVRVRPGEAVHFGVHRTFHDQGSGNQGDLIITVRYRTMDGNEGTVGAVILTRNRNSSRHMLLNNGQAGVIETAAQASAGPRTATNPTGYESRSTTNTSTEIRDYFFEFTQTGESSMSEGQRFSVYDFWDFTVLDNQGNEKPGRMFSKLWSFSAGGADNVFSKTFNMYPLIPSEDQADRYYVKKLELAGIAPQNFFRFVTNRYGTRAGSTVESRRKSQNNQSDYPEFFSFVNDPDPELWPSAATPTFNATAIASCNTSTGGGKVTFNATSSERSTFIVLVNLNGVAGYQPGTADVLLEQTGPRGAKSLEWNGLDGLGKVVAKGSSVNYFFKNAAAPINFPMWDAETNVGGFRVEDVRPLKGTNYNSELYWDDTNLSTALFPSPQSQLFGISSSGGAHSWGNTTNNTNAGDLKTINTWTYGYTNTSVQTLALDYECTADIALTKTITPGPYIIGKPLEYTLTVTNNGPLLATGVSVSDPLDTKNLEFISASDAAYNSASGVWSIGTLAAGATKTLTIVAQPKVTGNLRETAIASANEQDNNTANNTAAVTITVVDAADIEVRNTVPKLTYNNGDIVPYTITVKNLGPNAATGVSVTSKLPAGLVLEGSSPAGYVAATGIWTAGNLAVGETKTLVLNARITQLGSISTTASLNDRSSFQIDENISNNTSSNTIIVNPAADVAVSVSVSDDTPDQGQTILFTITATSNGPNSATNVVVTNAIPEGFEITGYGGTTGTLNLSNYTWSVGSIPTGTTHTLYLQARASTVGDYTFTSSQTHSEFDGNTANNSASTPLTVSPTADVAVTNTVSPVRAAYANGDVVTYTVVVTNNGPSMATNVVVNDKLPASLTFNSFTSTTGTYSAATGDWNVGTLANGESATLTITATINKSDVITTTAVQTHTETDNVNGNNRASNSIQSGSGVVTADILIEVIASEEATYTGEKVTFTVKATNTGPDAATDLSLNARIPEGMELVSATPKVGSYDITTGVWSVGMLASETYTELILVAKPLPNNTVTGDITYRVTASVATVAESQGGNINTDTDHADLLVLKSADLITSIVVEGDVDGVFYRGLTEATFTITVTNDGPDVITNLIGQDTRTGNITFTAAPVASDGSTYSIVDGLWRIPFLNPGEAKTLIVKGIPNTTGRLNLGGLKVSQDQYDPILENDKAIALLNVVPVADLEVSNTLAEGPHYTGQVTILTVQVKNNSADAASGVTILDKLPEGLTLVKYTATAGSYDPTTGIWTLGTDLLPGDTNAQTLVLSVKPTTTDALTTTASISAANEYDSNAANNSQAATIQANAAADIALSSTLEEGPYYVGGQYRLTVTVTNIGPDAATGVVVAAAVSPGLSLVPGSGVPDAGTSIDPASGLWTVGDLGLNESKTLIMLVEPLTSGTLYNSGYKQFSNEFDVNGGNTPNGNNSTFINLTVTDRPAIVEVLLTDKHLFFFNTGSLIAKFTDPDGAIANASVVNGVLPAGILLQNNGDLVISDRQFINPGAYTLTIETVDALGSKTQHVVNYNITFDWDNDGVSDLEDIDDNNDGITDVYSGNGADPAVDADGDGIANYYDQNYIHPVYGVFRDRNGDGINDVFDKDLDGLINSLDIDMDGDGILNVLEANSGEAPSASIFNAQKGTINGAVSSNGMPVTSQTGSNSGVSIFAMPDTDQDSYKDFLDIDADNDGILDNVEAQTTSGFKVKSYADSDLDGFNDAYDLDHGGTPPTPIDTDGDNIPDYLDLDSDNDLTPDYEEAFDDDNDGMAMNDMINRAARFEARMAKGYYSTLDTDQDKKPDWLEEHNARIAYLSSGSSYHYDSDQDGIVDLLDTDSGGVAAALQRNEQNEYDFRDAGTITPLPITLIKFSAKLVHHGVELRWATASEVNNDRFEVERSLDGKNFVVIGTVQGAGNISAVLHYSLLDQKAPAGTSYYRLKQVDFDGSHEYSSVVAVTLPSSKPNAAAKAILYPNPTSGIAYLSMKGLPAGNYTVSITSMEGRLIKQLELNNAVEQQLDLGGLAKGKYVLRLQSNEWLQQISFIIN